MPEAQEDPKMALSGEVAGKFPLGDQRIQPSHLLSCPAQLLNIHCWVRKYLNCQKMDRAPNVTHRLEGRLPMLATGKAN